MRDYLVSHAVKNVWCSPYQDRQWLLELRKVTGHGGVRNRFDYQWVSVQLPTENDYYHVYDIGQQSPARMNFPTDTNVWVSIATVATDRNILAQLYTRDGKMVSTQYSYLFRTDNLNYLIAVRRQPLVASLNAEPLYARFYSNAYFESVRDDSAELNIQVQGISSTGASSTLALQNVYHQWRNRSYGKAFAYVNGVYVDDFLPGETQTGDLVECVFDGSVVDSYDFKVTDLETFISTLDSQTKYVLHPPKGERAVIDYRDDVDVYLIKKTGNRWVGRLFNKNAESSVRMLTHRDYSIPSAFVEFYTSTVAGWSTLEDIYVRVVVRESGYSRPLVFEHHRIHELYKMTDTLIERALIGLDANVPEWSADSLESSHYPQVMRSRYSQITPTLVAQMYGYNAMAKYTGDTPVGVVDGRITVPAGLQTDATFFEYDANGLLLGYRTQSSGSEYYTLYPGAALVEICSGLGGTNPGFTFGTAPVTLNPLRGYRFYVSNKDGNGNVVNDWVDVTNDPTKYRVTNGVCTWLIDGADRQGLVKADHVFLLYTLNLPFASHLYQFNLVSGGLPGTPVPVPCGRLDLWLNGYALIENLDYYVKWPTVVLCNKEYLVAGNQQITVRMTGFCNSDLSRTLSTEVGWVKEGVISVDSVFHLRDDKVKRCVVGGRTFNAASLDFAEDLRYVASPVTNGRPYLVEDVFQPVRGMIDYDSLPLLSSSLDVDKRVSDYLSIKIPAPVEPPVNPIPDYYVLYSPFFAKVVGDIVAGFITAPPNHVTDAELSDWVQPYTYLLEYDPTKRGFDSTYSIIHPHSLTTVVTVESDAYLALQRINRMFCFNRLNLSHHIDIAVAP